MDAITMFKQAAAQLQKEEAYLYYAHARQQSDDDMELQDKIGEFNLLRMELQQLSGDESEAKAEELNRKISRMYTEIMDLPSMNNYNEAKEGMDTMMAYINAIIQAACDGEDPMLVEEPHGCSGSCSSCAGCH